MYMTLFIRFMHKKVDYFEYQKNEEVVQPLLSLKETMVECIIPPISAILCHALHEIVNKASLML